MMKRLALRTFMARYKDKDIRFEEAGPFGAHWVVLAYSRPRTNVWVTFEVTLPGWFIEIGVAHHLQGVEAKAADIRFCLGVAKEGGVA